MDPLEKFIRENKDDLRHRLKDKDSLWNKIDGDILPSNQVVVKKLAWQKWAVAASIFLAVGLGLLWQQSNNRGASNGSFASELPTEVLEIDAHYNKLINTRVRQVKNSKELSEQQKTEIISYLDKLEKESLDLEKELIVNINNVQIIQAMIENYRARLDVLEKLLNRSTNQRNKKHERNISI